MLCILCTTAHLTKRFKLHFQVPQFFDPMSDMSNVFIQKRVDLAAILGGGVPETKQHTNFIEGHVQTAAVADERQTMPVRFGVDAVVTFRSHGVRQQTFAFVVSNSFYLYTCQIGQFTDFHVSDDNRLTL